MEWKSVLFHTEDNEVYLHSVGIFSLTLTTTIGAKYYRCCQKHRSRLMHYRLSIDRHLLYVSFRTSIMSNLCTEHYIQ